MTSQVVAPDAFRWQTVVTRGWPVILGLLALTIPLAWHLAHTLWRTDDQGHGPILLCVVLWLVWSQREALAAIRATGSPAGWPLLVIGLCCYVVGTSQSIYFLAIGSLIPTVAGVTLLVFGRAGLRLLAFPLFFLVFLIPLPGALVEAITSSMKIHVSECAEALLYLCGLPIARAGVVLTVGPYELMVADACSGLNSMFSLLALGFLYLHLQRYVAWQRSLVLLAAIVPIAFFANVVRVIALVVITYCYGDAAGQGFVHDFAGLLMFLVALSAVLLVDWLLPGALLSRQTRGTR